jgi:hypothetical protein
MLRLGLDAEALIADHSVHESLKIHIVWPAKIGEGGGYRDFSAWRRARNRGRFDSECRRNPSPPKTSAMLCGSRPPGPALRLHRSAALSAALIRWAIILESCHGLQPKPRPNATVIKLVGEGSASK